jgi:hypothetical protein
MLTGVDINQVHQASCTSSQWTWYVNGVKDVLHATCPTNYGSNGIDGRNGEVLALLNWVYYHDVMARFTMRHWSGEAAKLPSNPSNIWPEGIMQVPNSRISKPVKDCVQRVGLSPWISLQLLSEISDAVLERTRLAAMTDQERDDYRDFLRVLDWKCRNMSVDSPSNTTPETTTVIELYRLAMLVYLNRACGDLLGQSARTQRHIDKAFTMFSEMNACERQFPVFVLGSEARTDEERAIVLNLMARTEKQNSSRSLTHVKILVQAMWAQDDLAVGELDYWDKMTTIISCCSIVPSLV